MYIDRYYFEQKTQLINSKLEYVCCIVLAAQPFMPNCPYSSGKCPGLGKNETNYSC